ncbi:MAG: dihydrofolate reductase [Bacteroidales bacterium]|nr:dihydrofolate reductase [Bacteroidales bacterium]MBN2818133.1 dihydrofolate reductase [Bacteroidales bacterium]
MAKTISIIVAVAEDYGIGHKNQLLTHLSNDLKRFREITTGHPVIMGRNTWFSLPNKPLKNRKNIVITNIENEKFEGAEAVFSIDEAIAHCPENEESFIIGGAMIYRQFFTIANKLYITRMHKKFEADTFFPEIEEEHWKVEKESEFFYDEKADLKYQYITFSRRQDV